ncbi:MAG: stage II sporulation protein D [Oscillibacter sp.]
MKRGSKAKQSIGVSVLLLLALFILPLVVIVPFRTGLFSSEPPVTESDTPFVPGDVDGQTALRVLNGDAVEEMTMGAYLVGVVRAEMPASFESEALKAQAVAARTYTLYKIQSGGNHGAAADICTDHTCCQAYLSEEKARSNWGREADAYEKKIEAAVRDTDGQTALYDGTPILAVFHSSSAGKTRASGEVWLSDLPYLQSVSSPEEGEGIPNYYSRAEFTSAEVKEKFLAAHPEADFSGPMSGWLTDAVTDSAGSVETLRVGGVTVKGATLRGILGLRSACFDWEIQKGKLVFFVTGYGHGVGMSQYGANAMAKSGEDYRAIVTHYYSGVSVAPYLPQLGDR